MPADVRASAAALASCGRYCFVSSISAYASFTHAPVRESDALAASDGIAEDDRDRARHYGPQKAACERVVAAAFGERALIVRPGLIVGPGDRTGRFSYWPWRALAGGEMLVPDVSGDEPIQLIDVRDLADWIVRAVEARRERRLQRDRTAGRPRLRLGRSARGVHRRGAPARRRAAALRPGRRGVPASSKASRRGTSCRSGCRRPIRSTSASPASIAAARSPPASSTRPLAETVDAVLDEFATLVDDDPRRRGKLTPSASAS